MMVERCGCGLFVDEVCYQGPAFLAVAEGLVCCAGSCSTCKKIGPWQTTLELFLTGAVLSATHCAVRHVHVSNGKSRVAVPKLLFGGSTGISQILCFTIHPVCHAVSCYATPCCAAPQKHPPPTHTTTTGCASSSPSNWPSTVSTWVTANCHTQHQATFQTPTATGSN